MSKANDLDYQRIKVLMDHEAGMTQDKAEKLLYRWKKGRSAPSVKQVERVLKKAGLNDRTA